MLSEFRLGSIGSFHLTRDPPSDPQTALAIHRLPRIRRIDRAGPTDCALSVDYGSSSDSARFSAIDVCTRRAGGLSLWVDVEVNSALFYIMFSDLAPVVKD